MVYKGGLLMKSKTEPKKNRRFLGILLIILGIIGLILPVMPGWVFLLAGWTML
jgi:hypothetical protein